MAMKVEYDKKNKKLKIEIDTNEPFHDSKSGKTLIVASTNGNMPTEAMADGQNIVVGFNAWIKNPKYKKE